MRIAWLVLVPVTMAAASRATAQSEFNHLQPRPPLLLELSRTERVETAVRMYVHEFWAAVQRGDTVAISSLVPEDVIQRTEKPTATLAGCASVGLATARLRAARAGEATSTQFPLGNVILSNLSIVVGARADTAARVSAWMMERRAGKTRLARVEIDFVETAGSLRVAVAKGVLAGLCGMATTR